MQPGGSAAGNPWETLLTGLAEFIDKRVGWSRLPLPLGLATLIAARLKLRRDNLFDTNTAPSINPPELQGGSRQYLTARSPDGSFNDLQHPEMGATGTRFGRNVPIVRTYREGPE